MMVEQKDYDQAVRAFEALENWATKAKKLLEQLRDHPDTNARLAVAAKCLVWDWKGGAEKAEVPTPPELTEPKADTA